MIIFIFLTVKLAFMIYYGNGSSYIWQISHHLKVCRLLRQQTPLSPLNSQMYKSSNVADYGSEFLPLMTSTHRKRHEPRKNQYFRYSDLHSNLPSLLMYLCLAIVSVKTGSVQGQRSSTTPCPGNENNRNFITNMSAKFRSRKMTKWRIFYPTAQTDATAKPRFFSFISR